MEHPGNNQREFKIHAVIEQRSFESEPSQAFFAKWCEANDSIDPQIVNRDIWVEKKQTGILEASGDGKQTLYIPSDIKLWEMMDIVEAVDQDTFVGKPERQEEAKEKIIDLGKTFQGAGIYLAQRLDTIIDGHEIAEALAKEFYRYGQLLADQKKPDYAETLEEIASHSLQGEELANLDRFFAGDSLYESRKIKAGGSIDEEMREKTLAQFFRVSQKAYDLEQKQLKEADIKAKPWKSYTSVHKSFISKIEKAGAREIETPIREIKSAIFRRGMELLQKTMGINKLPESIQKSYLCIITGEETLRETLDIDSAKAELDIVRESDDLVLIGKKEREIADKIQRAVSSYPYELTMSNPSEMVATQTLNCVGASLLGGALMAEVGLKYLVSVEPNHSTLFLITSDGQVEWRDFLKNPSMNILENRDHGRARDIVPEILEFSRQPKPAGLMCTVEQLTTKFDGFECYTAGCLKKTTLFEPERGLEIQVIYNAASIMRDIGHPEEALEGFTQAIALEPNCPTVYNGYGSLLLDLNRGEEALDAYRKALSIDPDEEFPYINLGILLTRMGRKKEAIEIYNKLIEIYKDGGTLGFRGNIEMAEKMISNLEAV